jgi:hypothetical protein
MMQTIIAQSGTTLYHVASDYLGDPLLWTRIALINNLQDPFLSIVTELSLPSSSAGLRQQLVR